MGSIRRSKTKRRTRYISDSNLSIWPCSNCAVRHRDLDQIHADLRSPKQLAHRKAIKPAEDLPGLGRWYCIECAKWFEGEHSLVQHRRGKNHKRRFYFHTWVSLLVLAKYWLHTGYACYGRLPTHKRRPKLQRAWEPTTALGKLQKLQLLNTSPWQWMLCNPNMVKRGISIHPGQGNNSTILTGIQQHCSWIPWRLGSLTRTASHLA